MKKWISFAVVIYFLTAGILIMFVNEKPSEIKILSHIKNYSRMITDSSESIDIPLYFSSEKNFLTDIDNIDTVSLFDKDNTIVLHPKDIIDKEARYLYQNNFYYLYLFAFDWEDFSLENTKLDFKNASLRIVYANLEEYDFEIGNVSFNFTDIENENYLELTRLYSITNKFDNKDYITGLVIGINNLTKQEINITSIDMGYDNISFDMRNVKVLTEPISYDKDINDILEFEYQTVVDEFSDNESISLVDKQLLFIPIRYLNKLLEINRFPIVIIYEYNEKAYEFKIDDFLFFSSNYNLEDDYENVREYSYSY